MKIIEQLPDAVGLTVSIFSDNQAFVRATVRPKAALGQYLLQEFLRAIASSPVTVRLK